MSAFVLVLSLVPLAILARGAWAVWRFVCLAPEAKRHYQVAVWQKLRWRWLTRNLGLAYIDQHHRRRLRPRLPFSTAVHVEAKPRHLLRWPRAKFRADVHGIVADVRTIPKVGRMEVEASAEYIAAAWKCVRVQVSQPSPGRLTIRGLRTDPLAEPLAADVLPPFDGRHIVLGRDEWGQMRRVSLANVAGSVIAGNPGRGKTESAFSLAVQLVPSPAVELYVLDGGGGTDWSGFADAAVAYVDDDLGDAEELLTDLHDKMMIRRRSLQADLGVRNAWRVGPTADYPLRWLLVDEAHWYLDLEGAKGDPKREAHVRACRSMLTQMLRRGRAPMYHVSMLAQKPTSTGGLPPDIRDLAGLRWCFGLATIEGAVACLGDDIRQHPTMSPVLLQEAEHVGVAAALLRTGQSPYTLLRFPEVGEDLADRIAFEAGNRRNGQPGQVPPVPAQWPGTPYSVTALAAKAAHNGRPVQTNR